MLDGVPYADLFCALYIWGVQEKARRSTAKWLIDYFFK
jgi:hypothetical protein